MADQDYTAQLGSIVSEHRVSPRVFLLMVLFWAFIAGLSLGLLLLGGEVLFAIPAVFALLIVIYLLDWLAPGERIIVHERGMVHCGWGGIRNARTLYWDDIIEVTPMRVNPLESASGLADWQYNIRDVDGLELVIDNRFSGAQNLKAMVLSTFVDTWLPPLIEQIEAGISLRFGPLSLDSDMMILPDERALPLAGMRAIRHYPGWVRLTWADPEGVIHRFRVDGRVPNTILLKALVLHFQQRLQDRTALESMPVGRFLPNYFATEDDGDAWPLD